MHTSFEGAGWLLAVVHPGVYQCTSWSIEWCLTSPDRLCLALHQWLALVAGTPGVLSVQLPGAAASSGLTTELSITAACVVSGACLPSGLVWV